MSKRILITTIIVTLIAQLFIPVLGSEVKAETASSINMSNSMLDFFREARTGINANAVTHGELMVYGVFLSNFFTPWSTTIRDIHEDQRSDSISRKISEKFFGDANRSSEINKIHKMIGEDIAKTLSEAPERYALYRTQTDANNNKVITGEEFIKKLSDGDNDYYLYNSDGEVVFNLDTKATRATLQVLFGFAPEMLLSVDKGLRKITGMYMDAYGNIWGSYEGVTYSDFVLVLPAAMNPVVFSNSVGDNQKFPMTNVFAMGGLLKTEGNFFTGTNAQGYPPYYNIAKYFQVGSNMYNTQNIVNIFGVQSPFGYLGNSNAIRDGVGNFYFNYEQVLNFLEFTSDSIVDPNYTKVFLSVDVSKVDDIEDYFKDADSLFGTGDEAVRQRTALLEYFTTTSVFGMHEIEDRMYYFNTPNSSSPDTAKLADDSVGSWNDSLDHLVKEFRLFLKGSEGGYRFYNGAYSSSPFNSFILGYHNRSDSEKDSYLKNTLESYGVNPSSENIKFLRHFLDTGRLLTPEEDHRNQNGAGQEIPDLSGLHSIYMNSSTEALGLIKKTTTSSSSGVYYNAVLPEPEISETVRIFKNRFLWIIPNRKKEDTAFAIGENDSYILKQHSDDLIHHGWQGGMTDEFLNRFSTYYFNFMTYRIFTTNVSFQRQASGTAPGSGSYETPQHSNWGTFTNRTAIIDEVNHFPGMYWAYMVSLLYDKDRDIWLRSYSNSFLPRADIGSRTAFDIEQIIRGGAGVVSSEDRTLEEMQEDILKKVYGLLSDGPNAYRDRLVKSSQDSWVLSTHRSITGSWVGNSFSVSAGGNSSYSSVVGYINTPSLSELPLTSWVMGDYMYVYLLLMLLMTMILVVMVLSNIRTLRQGVSIFLLMAVVLLLPQFLVSNVITATNLVGDKIYSERFNYWAIVQHQQSENNLSNSITDEDDIEYLIGRTMNTASNVYNTDAGVRLKWMSPKKFDVFTMLFSDAILSNEDNGLLSNLTIFRALFNSFFNQEEYTADKPFDTYLYRPYNSVVGIARDSYNSLKDQVVHLYSVQDKIRFADPVPGMPDYRFAKLLETTEEIPFTEDQERVIKQVKPLPALDQDESHHIEGYRYWIMNSDQVTRAVFSTNYSVDASAGMSQSPQDSFAEAFALATESPFYYFYNVIKSRYSDNGGFKEALLDAETFYVTDSDNPFVVGRLRDFLDLEGLFTYQIPYLAQANDYVAEWIARNGTNVSAYNFDLEGGVPSGDINIVLYNAERNKKDALRNVWMLYSPWVASLYDTGVINQTAYVADKKVMVMDALNPAAYEIYGRPMIFSEADMIAKSYALSDLSDVEAKIQSVLKDTYKDLMYLVNYWDFDEEVLVSAAAMMATFNFNREFSDSKLIGESIILYPQGFELKNFNYDAFMRLLLMNSTGEPIMGDKDLYVRILENTSIFTGLMLLANDVTAVILIPTMKVIVLLLLLFLSIVLCLVVVVAPPDRIIKDTLRKVGLPILIYFLATSSFAFGVSLFMGEGLTVYVGSRTPTLGLTDPTITLVLMLVLDAAYIYVLWRLIRLLFTSFTTNLTTVTMTTLAAVGGIGSSIVSKGLSTFKGMTAGAASVIAGGLGVMDRGVSDRSSRKEFASTSEEHLGGGGGEPTSGVGDGGRTISGERDTDFYDEINKKASSSVGGLEKQKSDSGKAVSKGSNTDTGKKTINGILDKKVKGVGDVKESEKAQETSKSQELKASVKNRTDDMVKIQQQVNKQSVVLGRKLDNLGQFTAKSHLRLDKGQSKIYNQVKSVGRAVKRRK